MKPIEKAMKLAHGGSALAAALGVATSAPRMWATRNKVPAEHCPSIERITGVQCEKLRPDVEWWVLRGVLPQPVKQRSKKVKA